MQIVTGRTGEPHVTSVQDRSLNQGIAGKDVYILKTGQNLQVEIAGNNEIHINDGALLFQGCLCAVDPATYDSITIPNGTQGMKRKDLITVRYTYTGNSQIETAEWGYIQGIPASSNPVLPTITNTGDLQVLDPVVDGAVFCVNLDGVNITGVEVLAPLIDSLSDLIEELKSCNDKINSNASKITEIQNDLSGLNFSVNSLNSNVNSANSKINSLTSRISTAESDISKLEVLSGNKVLWNGNERMRDGQSITLSDSISNQAHGIALKWAVASDGSSDPYGNYSYQVIFKGTLGRHIYNVSQPDFSLNASKIINLVNATTLSGSAENIETGTRNGVTYENNRLVLVQVLGW